MMREFPFRRRIQCVAGLLGCLLLAACTTNGPLALGERGGVAAPASTIDILYVTDRNRETAADGSITYGSKRSKVMSFGAVRLAETSAKDSAGKPRLEIARVTEDGAFPAFPYAMEPAEGGFRRTPAAVEAHGRAVAELRAEVSRSLAAAKRKEVVFFIHGYANEFDDAAESTGSLCRSLHSEFVCVALTWPAGGSGGAFMGYNVDRESGEFAVADMKKAIRIIATTPGVEGIHLIAHSRGTDVLVSALQQLGIEAFVGRSSLTERFKIRNLVLFAADMDMDVATSKLFGFGSDPDLPVGEKSNPSGIMRNSNVQLTVYSSPKDRALGLSSRIFGSQTRLGQLSLPKFAASRPLERAPSAQMAQWIDFIEFNGKAGFIGHSYFLSNPAVNADLVALIRDGVKAGDPRRHLVEIRRPFWRLVETGVPPSN